MQIQRTGYDEKTIVLKANIRVVRYPLCEKVEKYAKYMTKQENSKKSSKKCRDFDTKRMAFHGTCNNFHASYN